MFGITLLRPSAAKRANERKIYRSSWQTYKEGERIGPGFHSPVVWILKRTVLFFADEGGVR